MNFDNTQNWDNLSMNGMNNMGCANNMGGMDCGCMEPMRSCCMEPIYECPEERVCHRYMCYEVPQE